MRIAPLVLSAVIAATATASAQALDCGQPPFRKPTLPSDISNLTLEQLRDIRSKVVNYSGAVDTYLNCMDAESEKLSRFMTKEQRARRDQDLNDLHERRREVQVQLNEIIRNFRARTGTDS